MEPASAIATYRIGEPFDRAVKLVRRVLSRTGLRITGELNLSGRIQRMLPVQTAPCVVLFATSAGFAPAELAPLHFIISARRRITEVLVLRVLPRGDGTPDHHMPAARRDLQTLASEAMQTVGLRSGLGV